MKTRYFSLSLVLFLLVLGVPKESRAQFPRFKVLAFYNPKVERAHVDFARDAIRFFRDLTIGNGFVFDTTSNMADMNDAVLGNYQVVMMLNDVVHAPEQRAAFRRYMENGGGWYGLHVAGYNDRKTDWPWFVDFLGGAVFYRNNWPPMPAKLVVDTHQHPITRGLPDTFIAPLNEWYQWKPSPRERSNVQVLLSLAPENYPFGLKDILPGGDTPVVWTNTDYRMIYLNMGHGGNIFSDATQNKLFIDALRWLVAADKKGNVFGE